MDRGIKVLHVDDDPDVPELAGTFLEREDDRLTVESASDAETALERLADGEFECVVSDYEMPGMDGLEFLEAVREEYPDLPFVLFTGKGSEAVASEAISAGVTDYLQKGAATEQFELLANRITNAVSQARAEQELAVERRRFQLLFERLSQPTVEVEYEGEEPVVKRVNPAFEEKFGYARDDIVGESLDAYIVPEEYQQEAEQINDRVQQGGRLESEEVTRMTADGPRRFLLQNAVYSDGSGGFAIYSDVTEQKADEERLKQSLDLLHHTERLAGTGGWEFDIETGDIHWTDGAYAVHGIDPDSDFEPTPVSVGELYHPEDRERIQRIITGVLQNGEPLNEELRLQPPDGGLRWVRIGGEPVTDEGEVVALRGAIEDVTERKERERELQRQNDLFTQAQEIASIGAWETDLETGKGWWTEQIARIYGLPPEYEPDPGEGVEYFIPEDRSKIRTAYQRALEEGEPYDLELRVKSEDGVLRWVRARGEPKFEDGEVVRVRGTMQDITERKERERELQRQNERLEDFASVVSHDLRNPLTVAKGRLELARSESDGENEDLAAVAEAHERMEALIGDLLELARSGQQVENLEQVDLASVAENCYGNVETAGATLVVDTTTTVLADESRLRQLFENLFRNAVEHGPGGDAAGGDPVTITVGDIEGGAGFYVEDDGVGIPADDREEVFESGFSTSDEGTGFGLAIAQGIAETHGWRIDATESAAGGARFEITGVDTAP